ncbi:hypothetical protein DYB32_002071 [Aphanomyces invadans]|uniref:beta-ketoacyl-[acyl-carrier-protein] synthase I n=1 Tax=Aphanomyces invadans TaxID=157072 RepID=A0A418B4F7_9STRA|nr:hypothetical protein DYB32_002071 [Aphanomyces invadans]
MVFGPPPTALSRRVVVTGLGAVTPLGVGIEATWKRLIDGECGISAITSFDTTGLECKIGGQVPDTFHAVDHINPREARSQDVRFISFAIAAANEALRDANWTPKTEQDKVRAGVAIGAGIGNLQEIADTGMLIQQQKFRRVSPFFVPRILINLAAGHVSMMHELKVSSTSSWTGQRRRAAVGSKPRMHHSVRYREPQYWRRLSLHSKRRSRYRAMVSTLTRFVQFNESPHQASRPFDEHRDGFVMGEGAGMCVLEVPSRARTAMTRRHVQEYDHAKARGARIYGEIRGYGLSGDAHHLTAPRENGDGAYRWVPCHSRVARRYLSTPPSAMESALRQSGLEPSDIDYINAHATSTPLGDAAENRAIKRLFGTHPFSSWAVDPT